MEDSDKLLLRVGDWAEAEGYHIVPFNQINFEDLKNSGVELADYWRIEGWGNLYTEHNGVARTHSFSISDQGMKKWKSLDRRRRNQSFWARMNRDGLPWLTFFTALVSAIAAIGSAYFAYKATGN